MVVRACRVDVKGPLAQFAAGIHEVLLAEGYLEASARALMRLVAEVSRWLGERGLGAVDLGEQVTEEFFAAGGGRRCQGRSPRSLQPIVAYLSPLDWTRRSWSSAP